MINARIIVVYFMERQFVDSLRAENSYAIALRDRQYCGRVD